MIRTNKINTYLLLIILITTNACSDFLDIVPDDIATIDDAFDDQNSAESYLFTCYSYMPELGDPNNNPALLGGDEAYKQTGIIRIAANIDVSFRMQAIALGAQNPDSPVADYWNGANGGLNLYRGIRDCNVFLENIDNVIVIDKDLKKRWIAEAKFLKAYYSFYLFRMYGPIVIFEKNLPIDADISEIQKGRSTVDETVDYISTLFLEASTDLPIAIGDIQNELGRATQGASLALRAKLLTTAASPLFNGNSDYQNVLDKDGNNLFPVYDANKWNVAMEACRLAVEAIEGAGIQLYEFDPSALPLPSGSTILDVPEEIINTLTIQQSLAERWTSEKLFVSTKGLASLIQNRAAARTSEEFSANTGCYSFYSPTLRIAEMFYTKNGVPINEDINWNYGNRYQLRKYDVNSDSDYNSNGVPDNKYFIKNGETTINLHFDRETRFYGSLGFDRGIWYGNPATYNSNGAAAGFEDHYLEARATEYSGNNVGLGYESQTGYFAKKLTNYDNVISVTSSTSYSKVTYAFPEIRLSDLYLLYAECLNEIDNRAQAYIYIDKVRERANLKGVVESWGNFSNNPSKPSTKAGLRQIIQQERMIELVFEGHRFWDLNRWKLAESYMNKPFKGWTYTQQDPEDYYVPTTLGFPEFTFKNYLWPIKTNEILSSPNLTQNGGW
jgi:hypothetical protein